MKHFLYMDNNLLASYYSQAFGGLATTRQQTVGDSTTDTTSEGHTTGALDLEGKVNFLMASVQGKTSHSFESPSATWSQNQFAQELVTSTMHDNMFDLVVKHASEQNLIDATCSSINKYVDIVLPLRIVDFYATARMLGQKEADFIYYNCFASEYYKANKPGVEFDIRKPLSSSDEADKHAKKALAQFKLAATALESISAMMPYSTFFTGTVGEKTIVIPTKDEMYKEPKSYASSVFGGDVHIFGRISKIGASDENNMLLRSAAEINKLLYSFVKNLCDITIDSSAIFILPMAIYCE